jgi:nicotinamidase-related amidase
LISAGPLVARMAWLMRVASTLQIPIVAAAEDMADNGGLVEGIVTARPEGPKVFDKLVFGRCGQADMLAGVTETGRDEFVLIGLETDVCICHSALGLQGKGYRVAAIADATGSLPPHHEAGLSRMARAGIIITNAKGIY